MSVVKSVVDVPASVEIRSAFDPQSEVTIVAEAEGKKPTFDILAYTGGKLNMPELKYPVIVDLAGLETKQKRPVLYDHQPREALGHSEAITVTQTIRATGPFSGRHPKVADVVEMGIEGFPWQASIRAELSAIEYLAPQTSTIVNGQQQTGPAYISRKSLLREITIAEMGVDDDTSVVVKAMLDGKGSEGKNTGASVRSEIRRLQDGGMTLEEIGKVVDRSAGTLSSILNEEIQNPPSMLLNALKEIKVKPKPEDGTTVQASVTSGIRDTQAEIDAHNAAVAENAERVSSIQTICATFGGPKFTPEGETKPVLLESYAIKANWKPDVVKAIASRHDRPQGPAIHSQNQEVPTALVIEAAICRQGNLKDLDKQFSDQTLDQVDKNRELKHGVSLNQVLLMAAFAGGYQGSLTKLTMSELPTVIRAAFSTQGLQSVLSNAANKFLMQGFNKGRQDWKKLSAIRSVNNFLEHTRYRLVDGGEFQEIPASGEIPHGELSDRKYSNQAKQHGLLISIDRTVIKNDDIGILTEFPVALARGARKGLNRKFWAEYTRNAGNFFSTGNGNYISGADTNLSIPALTKAVAALKKLKDDDGVTPMDTMGMYLVCGASLQTVAETIYNANTIVLGDGPAQPNNNPHAGRYEVCSTAHIADPDEWYLQADPDDVPMIETAFVDGVEEPMIQEAVPTPTHTGVIMSGLYDFGIKKQDQRGAVKSKGKA